MNRSKMLITELNRLSRPDRRRLTLEQFTFNNKNNFYENDDPEYSDYGDDDNMGRDYDMNISKRGIQPIKGELMQIRQIALNALSRLADDPTSESYQMMKKILMMGDKAVEASETPDGSDTKKKK